MMKNTSVITLAVSTCFISLMLLTFSVTAESGVTGYGNYNLSLTCESMALPQDKPDAGQADPKDKIIKDLKSQVKSLTDSVDRQNGRIEDLNKTIANQESLLDSLKTQEVSDSRETADGDGQQAAENEKKSGNFFYILMIFLILGVSITALVLTLLIMFRMPRRNRESKNRQGSSISEPRKNDNGRKSKKGQYKDHETRNNEGDNFIDSPDSYDDAFKNEWSNINDEIKTLIQKVFVKGLKELKEQDESLNKACQNQLQEYEKKINKFEEEKEKAIQEATKGLREECEGFRSDLEKLKNNHQKELKKIDEAHKIEIDKIKDEHNREIESLKKEQDEKLKKYSKSVKIYNGCEEFSKPAVELFEQIDGLRQKQLELCEKVQQKNLSDEVKDEFNYYYTYVVGKFEKAIKDFDVKKFEREFFMLNNAGMALTGQTIDDYLKTSDSKQYVANLQHLSYEAGLGKLCGAAVVLSDDLCSLSRFCKDSVSESDVKDFGNITKELLKNINELGYEPAYVKLFESIKKNSDKAEVINKKELDGFADGDIVEVLKMAVNFREKKSKTQVCTKG